MTRSSQQTYIQRLGFQDQDRANPRHGLACEYLLDRLIEQNVFPNLQELKANAIKSFLNYKTEEIKDLNYKYKNLEYQSKWNASASEEAKHVINTVNEQTLLLSRVHQAAENISESEMKQIIHKTMPPSQFISVPITSGKFVNGFADLLLNKTPYFYFDDDLSLKSDLRHNYLNILGEIKITPEPAENVIQQIAFYREFVDVSEVIILIDYDAPQLKRMTEGSDIKVYRLGAKFDKWCSTKTQSITEEF
jgi:hypothetical protein